MHCKLKTARRRGSRLPLLLRAPQCAKFNNSTISFAFGDPDFVAGTDILAMLGIYHYFGHIFTAHVHKLLFSSFPSKLWYHR